MRRGSHYERAAIADYINPDNGYRGKMERMGKTPKNFEKENRKDIVAIQQRNRQQKEDLERQKKEPFKLSQFQNVEPKLYEERINEDRPNFNNFLTRNESQKRLERLAEERRLQRVELMAKLDNDNFDEKPISPRKPSVPKANECSRPERRNSGANFIQINKVKAQTMDPPKKEKENEEHRHESYGKVPEYLEQRKAMWAEEQEEMRRRAPDPNCPPGMRLMPENERMSTLEVLMRSKEEAQRAFNNLPFITETVSLRKKKNDLEMKLREIDHAIGLFNKPKVYVAMN
jgi:hypothetical protein